MSPVAESAISIILTHKTYALSLTKHAYFILCVCVYVCVCVCVCAGTMNRVKEIERINTVEVENGIPDSASWHAEYRKSAYCIASGLDFRLSEGDLITVFSQ